MGAISSTLSKHCRALEQPDPLTVYLAVFILVGVLVSYLPQHIKIIQYGTSEGLSPWWVLLGGLSSIAAIGNILTLPASRADMACCKEISGGACAAALLGVAQIGLQWACFMFSVMLFLIFFPTAPDLDISSSIASITSSPPPKRRDAIIVGSTTLCALLVVGITSIALVAAWPHHTQYWANFLGSIAGLLAAVQYVPQIWYTYRLGDVKSLSVITMLIQVPGAFLFSFSLWLRVGWGGWSTWLVYVVTGILQGILLAMAISYYVVSRRATREQVEAEEEEEVGNNDDILCASAAADGALLDTDMDERSPLLQNGSMKSKRNESTMRSTSTNRQFGMLYAATPPEQDSDRSSRFGG
ncbi:hypothetical protein M433DRAFT_281782 [Acidomyces richmondensis BFW]|nr:hypothetical protein M433DRAFT_281782 [Acidomyces richmondensis BFW]